MTGGSATIMALDPATAGLVSVAAAIHAGAAGGLAERFAEARAQGTSAAWCDELVLMAVLFAGFPRALVAASALRTVEPGHGAVGDAADYRHAGTWQARGEAVCRQVYGANYEALRRNVRALHPALDAWIIADGYGRTIGRPELDLRRRELCAIAMLVPQDVPRQLHSHLRGALNAGATESDVTETLAITARAPGVDAERLRVARGQWDALRRGADA